MVELQCLAAGHQALERLHDDPDTGARDVLEPAAVERHRTRQCLQGRQRAVERDWSPNIGLGLPVLIPEAYVRDLPVRLGLYRRIGALASDAETEAMAAELVDRFGALPTEVDNLEHEGNGQTRSPRASSRAVG